MLLTIVSLDSPIFPLKFTAYIAARAFSTEYDPEDFFKKYPQITKAQVEKAVEDIYQYTRTGLLEQIPYVIPAGSEERYRKIFRENENKVDETAANIAKNAKVRAEELLVEFGMSLFFLSIFISISISHPCLLISLSALRD